MTDITCIKVHIETGSQSGAGTDGSVYLGIGGREFHCDTKSDDFETGSIRDYIFGLDHNIQNSDINDPRSPLITFEDVVAFPVYIRFDQGTASAWQLQRATVYLNNLFPQFYEKLFGKDGDLWLGRNSGCICYLPKHADGWA